MLRKILAWVLLALTCYTASSNAQDYTTGNLINPALWTGTNYGNLPGDCCTGGPMPLYNNQLGGGGISFSYGQATVSQDININQALSGSGIVVKGYNYHWHITTNTANGVDPVYGKVTLFSNTNSPLETFNYNYTNAMNETIFSGTQNFSTNYSLAAVSNLNVSFTARDQGFWAGYYGPKVNHIVVSMNYGVDQCASNPLYSTQCAGYAQAYLTLQCSSNPLYSTSCTGYAQAYQDQQCAANPLYSPSCSGYQAAYLSQQCSSNQLYSTSCPGYQTAYATKMALENQKKAATETSTASTTTTTTTDSSSSGSSSGSTTTSSGSTTVAVGGTVTDSTSTTAEVKLDLGGATVSTTGEIKPADNIPDVARPTTASSTTTGETMTASVQQQERKTSNVNALSIARNAVAAAENVARSVASESAKMSYSENSNPSDGMGLSLGATGLGFSIPGLNAAQNNGMQQNDQLVQKAYAYVAPVQEQVYIAPVQEQFFNTKQISSNSSSQGMEIPTLPTNNSSHTSAFDMKQNSIASIQEQRQETNFTVKNKSEVSELAGGVDIKTLAAAPVGYDLYLMSSLRDNPFYAPKDIYKNQNNVDNVRALRQMSSDALHQQMINLQYK